MNTLFGAPVPLFEDLYNATALGNGIIIAILVCIGVYILLFTVLAFIRKHIDKNK